MIWLYLIIGWLVFVLVAEAAVLIKKPSLSWHDFIEMCTKSHDPSHETPFTLPVWVGMYATALYWIIALSLIFRR